MFRKSKGEGWVYIARRKTAPGPAIPSNGREENFPIILCLCSTPFDRSSVSPPLPISIARYRGGKRILERVTRSNSDETHSATIDAFASRQTRRGGGIKSSALYIIISVKRLGLQVI